MIQSSFARKVLFSMALVFCSTTFAQELVDTSHIAVGTYVIPGHMDDVHVPLVRIHKDARGLLVSGDLLYKLNDYRRLQYSFYNVLLNKRTSDGHWIGLKGSVVIPVGNGSCVYEIEIQLQETRTGFGGSTETFLISAKTPEKLFDQKNQCIEKPLLTTTWTHITEPYLLIDKN